MNTQNQSSKMRIKPVGHALSLFIAISFVACVVWGLLTPLPMHMHTAWEALLPGFTWLSPSGFVIGLVESYLYGWWIALIYVPLYNWFSKS